ncbi:hypothetical protein M0812_08407 [Anaeramoeba flamelloides]|uniref:Uncharacterized protein n=1 Tax=Anaeramoeba flamelloides TaxID=1746091 RepID=A0AAV8A1I2_9EUKA|nr:hypothetical protein M0812_08407 [Anaeramoeba flamelloides]
MNKLLNSPLIQSEVPLQVKHIFPTSDLKQQINLNTKLYETTISSRLDLKSGKSGVLPFHSSVEISQFIDNFKMNLSYSSSHLFKIVVESPNIVQNKINHQFSGCVTTSPSCYFQLLSHSPLYTFRLRQNLYNPFLASEISYRLRDCSFSLSFQGSTKNYLFRDLAAGVAYNKNGLFAAAKTDLEFKNVEINASIEALKRFSFGLKSKINTVNKKYAFTAGTKIKIPEYKSSVNASIDLNQNIIIGVQSKLLPMISISTTAVLDLLHLENFSLSSVGFSIDIGQK